MRPKILIVDDDKRNVLLLESTLKKDYDLRVAYSGEQALSVLESFAADVVLLDIMMPGMSGYDVCNAIREHDDWKFTKVLLISAKVLSNDRVLGYECGADDYVIKPFNIDEMRAKIKVFLRLKHREELDDLKSNLIMLIAHELRTPLTGISGATEILRESIGKDSELSDVFEILSGNSHRLKLFVEKIIQLSDIKNGLELNKIEISLKDIFLESQLNLNQHLIDLSLDEFLHDSRNTDELTVHADHYFISMAVSNLLQHIHELSTGELLLKFAWRQSPDFFEIHIYDANGKSYETDDLEQNCVPLSTKDIYHYHRGNGLAMAIVYGIVRAHEGVLDIQINDIGNQVFVIKLPSYCTV